ncbi:hypothetical protein [Catellatospora citrea]|uniref:Uncharacterized protein n=1 Tax=Catellatospora citrea TaxID=53366 RepID=A0A8J3KN31_9ACTN|nr:hypothetical protein [Catellatospora citrea]RKE10674.1 hypothetical protein C8E86_5590 [Catellatospora citrea]GIG03148.1 hypothetical protein Cci01nite_82410 [Catellatospora citrea]
MNTDTDLAEALHLLLLRLAGRVPDELVSRARSWLAADRPVDVARGVVFALLQSRIGLPGADAVVLAHVLLAADGNTDALAEVERTADADLPPFRFAPVDPDTLRLHDDQIAYNLDLTASDPDASSWDEHDSAVLHAVAAQPGPGVYALWRAWRYPATETPWPPPRRVYLVQSHGPAHTLPELTERLQQALAAAGDPDPQVETFTDPDDLPAYQRAALGYAALLWTAAQTPEVRIAALFDTVDAAGGPGFSPDHPLLEGTDLDRVSAYLTAGTALLASTVVMDDIVGSDRSVEVPMNFRTDGHWVWTDATTYYLTRHHLAPDPELVEHVLARQAADAQADAVALHRAMAALQATAFHDDADR